DTNLRTRRRLYPIPMQTVFGQIDFREPQEITLMLALRQNSQLYGLHEMFAYPADSAWYLLTGLRNPTRFEVALPGYNSPEHIDEVIRVLETRRVPMVAVGAIEIDWKSDPLLAYLDQHYHRVPLPIAAKVPLFVLFLRNDLTGPPPS